MAESTPWKLTVCDPAVRVTGAVTNRDQSEEAGRYVPTTAESTRTRKSSPPWLPAARWAAEKLNAYAPAVNVADCDTKPLD